MKNKKILSFILVITMIAVSFSAFLCLPTMTAAAATIVVTNANDSGDGSLRAALAAAGVGDLITFDKNAFPVTAETVIALNTALPDITKNNITVQGHLQTGANAGKPAVSIMRSALAGTPDFRILTVNAGVGTGVNLFGLKISNGKTSGAGGGVFSQGYVTAENCVFTANSITGNGGGMFAQTAILAENCTFTNNTATNSGGGAYASSSSGNKTTFENCTFTNNTAIENGGGLSSFQTTELTDSRFANNTAVRNGGGAYVGDWGNGLIAESCTFTLNTAGYYGGGVYSARTAQLTDTTCTDNEAANGGGIYVGNGGNLANGIIAEKCVFVDNQATNYGGGVTSVKAANLTDTSFTGNTVAGNGGGIYVEDNLTAETCVFEFNAAADGGGAYSHKTAKLTDSTFASNTATGNGGGAYAGSGGTGITAEDCVFKANAADTRGSGVFSSQTAKLIRSIFTGNAGPAGSVFSNGNLTAVNSMFTKNNASGSFAALETSSDVYLYHCTIASNTGSGVRVYKDSGAKASAYNSIVAGNSTGQVGYGETTFTSLALSGGSSLVEGIGGATYAKIFGSKSPDAKGILRPVSPGLADKTATALKASALTGSGVSDINQLAVDLTGAARSNTGAVDYGAMESNVPVANITISGAPANMKIGATATLKATVSPTNASNKAVTWKSSNSSIISVDANGKVTAKAPGTVTITATAKDGSGKTATCKITVLPLVSKLVITGAPAGMVKGKTVTLKVTVTPTNAADKTVSWQSSDTSIATVDANGKATAKAPGTVTITATAKDGSGVKASCKIIVSTNYITMKLGSTVMIWNGTKTTVDNAGTKPFTVSGRTMIPVRSCMEKFGAKVTYVSDSQPIVITYNGMKLELKLNSKVMKLTVGNKVTNITIDVPAQTVGTKTYLPLRAVSQAFGFAVYYDDAGKYILINSEAMDATLRNERLAEAKAVIK